MSYSRKNFIGILGGTFDPPHSGHLFISKYAKIKLDLKEIWWIVTYVNPLKKKNNDYKKRLNMTKKFLLNSNAKIYELDEPEKNFYTIDLLKSLSKKFPSKKFIWLTGIDNLDNFHLWKDWKKIFYNIPIAIFDRPSYSLNITKSKALNYFKKKRIKNKLSRQFKYMKPPKWIFVNGFVHPQSSTKIRLGKFE